MSIPSSRVVRSFCSTVWHHFKAFLAGRAATVEQISKQAYSKGLHSFCRCNFFRRSSDVSKSDAASRFSKKKSSPDRSHDMRDGFEKDEGQAVQPATEIVMPSGNDENEGVISQRDLQRMQSQVEGDAKRLREAQDELNEVQQHAKLWSEDKEQDVGSAALPQLHDEQKTQVPYTINDAEPIKESVALSQSEIELKQDVSACVDQLERQMLAVFTSDSQIWDRLENWFANASRFAETRVERFVENPALGYLDKSSPARYRNRLIIQALDKLSVPNRRTLLFQLDEEQRQALIESDIHLLPIEVRQRFEASINEVRYLDGLVTKLQEVIVKCVDENRVADWFVDLSNITKSDVELLSRAWIPSKSIADDFASYQNALILTAFAKLPFPPYDQETRAGLLRLLKPDDLVNLSKVLNQTHLGEAILQIVNTSYQEALRGKKIETEMEDARIGSKADEYTAQVKDALKELLEIKGQAEMLKTWLSRVRSTAEFFLPSEAKKPGFEGYRDMLIVTAVHALEPADQRRLIDVLKEEDKEALYKAGLRLE